MLTTEVKEIAQRIGQFFLERNSYDYNKTARFLESMRITEILVRDKEITIKLSRPGLIIGRKGTVIDALSKYLNMHVRIEEVQQHLYDFLVPHDYSGEIDF